MDFSVDDNSFRSAQAAADFTGLVQIQLGEEPNVEWVERAQLQRIKTEFALSALEGLSSSFPLHQGKLAGADWMITGQFSMDDRNRRTLFLEITDLRHADVLVSQTIVFPGNAAASIMWDTNQVTLTATAVAPAFV